MMLLSQEFRETWGIVQDRSLMRTQFLANLDLLFKML